MTKTLVYCSCDVSAISLLLEKVISSNKSNKICQTLCLHGCLQPIRPDLWVQTKLIALLLYSKLIKEVWFIISLSLTLYHSHLMWCRWKMYSFPFLTTSHLWGSRMCAMTSTSEKWVGSRGTCVKPPFHWVYSSVGVDSIVVSCCCC